MICTDSCLLCYSVFVLCLCYVYIYLYKVKSSIELMFFVCICKIHVYKIKLPLSYSINLINISHWHYQTHYYEFVTMPNIEINYKLFLNWIKIQLITLWKTTGPHDELIRLLNGLLNLLLYLKFNILLM